MTARICKNCKYWGHYRTGECDRVGGLFTDDPSVSFDITVRVLDDSGLSTGLVTGPNFGCVHFKSKRKRKTFA